ncbi:MAG: glycosyltransferase involved in cell wall biosynthesis [Lysobacterales bacterium]|jgi:glycosyltransferase involved in cell wall biosynthesis
MHVVQALAALSIGGSELVVAELAEHLSVNGHKVTVIGRDGPLSSRVTSSGATHLDWAIGRKRLGTLSYINRLAVWLEQHQPDIVHAHSRLPAWICWRAIARLDPAVRPKFITSMHGQYTVSFYSAVMARGDRVIAVSNHIREFSLKNYRFVDPEKIVTIHGGTSRTAFPGGYQPSESWQAQIFREFPELIGKRILLLPGRLSRYKGHAAFIELIARLHTQFPDIHGVILGQARAGSRYLAELEGLAQKGKVLDRVSFTGLRADIREWMAMSSIVFNLCSDPPEAFGRTVPEALRLGVPVIAWSHGGVKEILELMFPAGAVKANSFESLLKKTSLFLEHTPAIPENKAFLLSDSMEKHLDLYKSII